MTCYWTWPQRKDSTTRVLDFNVSWLLKVVCWSLFNWSIAVVWLGSLLASHCCCLLLQLPILTVTCALPISLWLDQWYSPAFIAAFTTPSCSGCWQCYAFSSYNFFFLHLHGNTNTFYIGIQLRTKQFDTNKTSNKQNKQTKPSKEWWLELVPSPPLWCLLQEIYFFQFDWNNPKK